MKRLNDAVVQSRVDKRCLATVSKWYVSRGVLPRSASELIRNILEDFVEILVSNGKVELIDNSEDARQILDDLFGNVFNPGRRGRDNEYVNLSMDDIERSPKLYANDPGYLNAAKRGGVSVEDCRIALEKAKKHVEFVPPRPFEVDENGLVINNFVEPKQIVPDWAKDKTKENDVRRVSNREDISNNALAPAHIDAEAWLKKKESQEREAAQAIECFDPFAGAIKAED